MLKGAEHTLGLHIHRKSIHMYAGDKMTITDKLQFTDHKHVCLIYKVQLLIDTYYHTKLCPKVLLLHILEIIYAKFCVEYYQDFHKRLRIQIQQICQCLWKI